MHLTLLLASTIIVKPRIINLTTMQGLTKGVLILLVLIVSGIAFKGIAYSIQGWALWDFRRQIGRWVVGVSFRILRGSDGQL
jgi:hypothetical protein